MKKLIFDVTFWVYIVILVLVSTFLVFADWHRCELCGMKTWKLEVK